ncbi:Glycosyltransferase involved in cell wall bisynthesis [Tistlia consotensis]|uniref:Glycosyltransferase involved in cell wall bisynthesis n=1 Tax=Tistlia consotensis USBA 355 TaxID=560819 RepID=A0A1Y6CG51_9PROT|nr:Glycosyltransferase involved in cell wall bisynthesis [Tistlia consotensis USBA 355]SNR95658.1 Glycosyltransferase involved in cell wall bisynthesis [Tistlia consotensis]
MRLAYLVTHPIQYQAPLLARIACEPDIELTAFFASELSLGAFRDPGFGREVTWDVPLLEGYRHEFLPCLGERRDLGILRPWSHGLARRLRRGGFQALWVHGYARPFHVWSLLAARALGLTTLLRDEATAISTRRGGAKRLLRAGFFAGLRPLVDRYLAIGSLNRAYWRALGVAEERIFDMPYAVDNARFQALAGAAAARRDAFRQELGLPPDRPVVLYASKLMARKRAGDLLEAFLGLGGAAAARRPLLLIVGDGELRATLEARVAEAGAAGSVRFLGFRNQAELPAFYELAEVFVLPSEHEPWGLVVNEAMNAGTAVIASDQVAAAHDLISPRRGRPETGVVFPVGDIAALRGALEQVLADPERAAALGRQALARVSAWDFEADVAGLRAALGLGPRGEAS